PTVDFYVALVKKAIGDWGFEGIKFDGQHLNAVAPCYNPAHKHAHPSDSVEGVATFWSAIHKAIHDTNPDAVVELCPCGTVFAFHNLPATDQCPAPARLSSWQVRGKRKTTEAPLAGRGSYSAAQGEVSESGDDYASAAGIGGVVRPGSARHRGPEHR